MPLSEERMRALRLTYHTSLTEGWKAATARWAREWEQAHEKLAVVDPADTIEIIRCQERIRLIKELIGEVERDVRQYEKERRKADGDD